MGGRKLIQGARDSSALRFPSRSRNQCRDAAEAVRFHRCGVVYAGGRFQQDGSILLHEGRGYVLQGERCRQLRRLEARPAPVGLLLPPKISSNQGSRFRTSSDRGRTPRGALSARPAAGVQGGLLFEPLTVEAVLRRAYDWLPNLQPVVGRLIKVNCTV